MERLQKYLASCGVASRRAAEKLIESGRVSVNGEIARLGCTVEPARDRVLVDGNTVGQEQFVYILLNKPPNTVTTSKDTHGRKTVLDCLAGVEARVYPVGRLDMDVGGVLLLTNDGELANRLIHPSYQIPKVYLAWVWGRADDEAIRHLEAGVMLEDGKTAPARARIMKRTPKQTLLRLQIHEGKKREVKRMCKAVGHPVANLTRIAFCGIQAADLRAGEWRYLRDEEVDGLRRATLKGPGEGAERPLE